MEIPLIPTPKLESVINQHLAASKDKSETMKAIKALWDKVCKHILAIPERGPDRAKLVHALFDDKFDKVHDRGKITCKIGCNFCCRINVDLTEEEAELLADRVTSEMITRLRVQVKSTGDKWTKELKGSDALCVFNKDGLCSVYDDRPLSCRACAVVSEPKLCDTAEHDGNIVQYIVPPQTEMIVAAYTVIDVMENNPGFEFKSYSMPAVLLRKIDQKLV